MSEVLVPEHTASAAAAQQQQQQQRAGSLQRSSSSPRSPLGLVLELQQDERELIEGLAQGGQQHYRQHRQQSLSPA